MNILIWTTIGMLKTKDNFQSDLDLVGYRIQSTLFISVVKKAV